MSSLPNSSSSRAAEIPPSRAQFRDVPIVIEVLLGKGGLPLHQLVRLEPGVVVFGLLGGLAWAARRGRLGFFTRQPAHVRVEATVPLGERRSLMVVAIEGRRLLLGLTPMQISLVTELSTQPSPAATEPGFSVASRSFDQVLARAEAAVPPTTQRS